MRMPDKKCGQVAWVSVRCDYGYTDRTGWAAMCNEKNAELTEPPSGHCERQREPVWRVPPTQDSSRATPRCGRGSVRFVC